MVPTMAPLTEPLMHAREEADRAASHAGVRIVPLREPDEVRRIPDLVGTVWGEAVRPTPDILRALAHAGGVLLAAEPQERPGDTAGAAFGFLGWDGGIHLHSHQVGVRPERRKSGVGYALKLAQRVTCLEYGITEMRWTFDPLIARNAGFNFGKLGVVGSAFLPNFYGPMTDAINSGDDSDRFEVSWRLDTPLRSRVDDDPGAALLDVDEEGRPRRTDVPVGPGARVPVPGDYAALRSSGDSTARAWRHTTRAAFARCFEAGLIAVAFGRGGYVFDEKRGKETAS